MNIKSRFMIILLIVLTMSAATYAFAAANTFDQSEYRLGDGEVDISGYEISNVGFTLNATNPGQLDTVTFSILPTSASSVQVNLGSGGWKTCTNSSGNVTCPGTGSYGIAVTSATKLQVVAKGD